MIRFEFSSCLLAGLFSRGSKSVQCEKAKQPKKAEKEKPYVMRKNGDQPLKYKKWLCHRSHSLFFSTNVISSPQIQWLAWTERTWFPTKLETPTSDLVTLSFPGRIHLGGPSEASSQRDTQPRGHLGLERNSEHTRMAECSIFKGRPGITRFYVKVGCLKLTIYLTWPGEHNQGAFTRHTWPPVAWTWVLAVRGRQGPATAEFNALNIWGWGRRHEERRWWSICEDVLPISLPSRSPASHLLQLISTTITSVQQGFEMLGTVLL